MQWLKAADDFIVNNFCKYLIKFRQYDTNVFVFHEPFKVPQGKWNAYKKMCFSFEQATEAVSPEYLQQADQDITIILAYKAAALNRLFQQLINKIHIVFKQTVLPF